MLSFKTGQKIAKIIYNKPEVTKQQSKQIKQQKPKTEFIYINDTVSDEPLINSKIKDELLPRSFYISTKLSPHQLILLKKAIRDDIIPTSEELKIFYEQSHEFLKEILKKNIEFAKSEASVFPVPKSEGWQGHMYITGASGSGKSTFIAQYLDVCRLMFKECNIYVFSMVQDDPAYKHLDPVYIKIDESILVKPLQCAEFAGTSQTPSFAIFDDIEVISNKKIAQSMETFQNLVLETGRHCFISSINVSHVMLNGNRSKKCINESDKIVFFPNSNFNQISNYLRRYLGLMKNDITLVKDIGKTSRWVMISRPYPMYLIHQHGVKII